MQYIYLIHHVSAKKISWCEQYKPNNTMYSHEAGFNYIFVFPCMFQKVYYIVVHFINLYISLIIYHFVIELYFMSLRIKTIIIIIIMSRILCLIIGFNYLLDEVVYDRFWATFVIMNAVAYQF